MARSLNKKYFGNRNVGADGTYATGEVLTAGAEVGGEGVASAAITVVGSYTTNRPAFTFSAPSIANGVTATGTITSKVISAAIGGTQTRAYPGLTGAISFAGGTTAATFTAALRSQALSTVAYASATTISFATTTTAYISGTDLVITGSGAGTMTIGGVALANGQTYYLGALTTATSATLYASYSDAVNATNPLAISNAATTGFTFTVGGVFSTVTALTLATAGSYEALVTGAQAAVANYGAGLTITPTYGALSVTITNSGSGYTAAPTIAGYTNQGGVTVATVVLTTDSGSVGTVTNRENAIVAYAYISGSLVEVDIQRQVSGTRYRVNKSGDTSREGTRLARLRSDAVADGAYGNTTAEGAEMNIVASDSDGGTYLVKKLTNHKAVLVPKAISRLGSSAGTQFPLNADGSAKNVAWTFNSTSGTKVLADRPYLQSGVNVKIENA
jgi:hypothetical protein